MTIRTCLFCLTLIVSAGRTTVLGQTPSGQAPDAGAAFPRAIDDRGFHIVVYQPQIDSWKKDRLEARSALTFSAEGAKNEMFGIVTLTARTDVDKETRRVWLEDLKISSVSF